jgi:hypothetical protein
MFIQSSIQGRFDGDFRQYLAKFSQLFFGFNTSGGWQS